MKASELRLGNWVLDSDRENPYLYQVVRIETKEYTDWNSGDEYNVIVIIEGSEDGYFEIEPRPIPLTEDWLIKFGFEKGSITHADKSITPISYKIDDNYRVQWFSNKSLSEVNTGELMFVSPKGLIRTIKYVHQLQNLYFALTGKELELKESPTESVCKTEGTF